MLADHVPLSGPGSRFPDKRPTSGEEASAQDPVAKIRDGGVIGLLIEVQCSIDDMRGPHVRAVLIAPGLIPRNRSVDACEAPHRALLDAMLNAHEVSEHDPSLLAEALRALREFEGVEHVIYREMLLSQFGKEQVMSALEALEAPASLDTDYELSDTELRSYLYVTGEERGLERGLEQGRAEGREEGRTQALLDILDARGLATSAAQRARILSCHDRELLRTWLVRALTCNSVDALLDA